MANTVEPNKAVALNSGSRLFHREHGLCFIINIHTGTTFDEQSYDLVTKRGRKILQGIPATEMIYFTSEMNHWYFADLEDPRGPKYWDVDGEPMTKEQIRDLRCCHCDCPRREDGKDPCLGELPGVKNACCGHGEPGKGYVSFENGVKIYGTFSNIITDRD